MQSNPPKSKPAKTVQPIKIVNNQVINNKWQQQQKPSKRNLPCSPNSPINIQEKKKNQNFFPRQTDSPYYLKTNPIQLITMTLIIKTIPQSHKQTKKTNHHQYM